MNTHLQHLHNRPGGIRVPLLYADSPDISADRSLVVDLDTDRHGRLITDSHPTVDGRTIVRVTLDGTPCWISPAWISPAWLAHRLCDDQCAGIWADVAAEYYRDRTTPWLVAHLEDGHYRGDVVILHTADELPAAATTARAS